MAKEASSVLRLGERAGYRFSIIAKRLNDALAIVHARKFGLPVNSWKLMSVIEFYGPLTGTELGKRTSLEPDRVTRSVDNLVRQGMVLRRQDDVDRRRVILTLSAKGKRVHAIVEQCGSALEVELLSVLTDEERGSLDGVLTKLEAQSAELFSRRENLFERGRTPPAEPRAKQTVARVKAAPTRARKSGA